MYGYGSEVCFFFFGIKQYVSVREVLTKQSQQYVLFSLKQYVCASGVFTELIRLSVYFVQTINNESVYQRKKGEHRVLSDMGNLRVIL